MTFMICIGRTGIAAALVNSMGVANTFYIFGVIFLILVTASAQLFKNPPKGWLPAGFKPPATAASAAQSLTFNEAVKTPQWWMLWLMLCLNISAGLGLLSQLSPMAQDIRWFKKRGASCPPFFMPFTLPSAQASRSRSRPRHR